VHKIVNIIRVPVFDNGRLMCEYKVYYRHDSHGRFSDIQEHSLVTLIECCIPLQENLAESFGIKCSITPRVFS